MSRRRANFILACIIVFGVSFWALVIYLGILLFG